ncbi:MAG: hypothetical protein M0Q22_02555 [Sulfuritalea sp.]|jgi:hypothetical protein|nr:hypothetical protein [Sulfuritalea sp.]
MGDEKSPIASSDNICQTSVGQRFISRMKAVILAGGPGQKLQHGEGVAAEMLDNTTGRINEFMGVGF